MFYPSHDSSRLVVSATAYSPPAAAGCGATYGVWIERLNGSRVKRRFGRFNVCRGGGDGTGWTRRTLYARLNISRLPYARYRILVGVLQKVDGVDNFHVIRRMRWI
jgi:hypothetical protein